MNLLGRSRNYYCYQTNRIKNEIKKKKKTNFKQIGCIRRTHREVFVRYASIIILYRHDVFVVLIYIHHFTRSYNIILLYFFAGGVTKKKKRRKNKTGT